MKTISCYFCKHTWELTSILGRREECPACHRDCKICLNCIYYDANAHRACREPQAELVRNKEAGNFCSFFTPASKHTHDNTTAATQSQLAALFKEPENPQPSRAPSPPRSLAELFKKPT